LPVELQLRAYWRALFRAAVVRAIDEQLARGALTPDGCLKRLNAFGGPAAREIDFVLESDHLVSPDADAADRYKAFAAVYLELAYFAGHVAEDFFPALPRGHAVRDAVADGLDPDALFRATRPVGAAEPDRETPPDDRWTAPEVGRPTGSTDAALATSGEIAGTLRQAEEAEQKGNLVRAAVLRMRASEASDGKLREAAFGMAADTLRRLVGQVGDALGWDAPARREWQQALGPLLKLAASGVWPRAARCLYELQRIPVELGRDVYAVSLPDYLLSFGRTPLRRPLPRAKPVLVLTALQKAHAQLVQAGLPEHEQLRLDRLLHDEHARRERAVRAEFTPVLAGALAAAGLTPANRVEEVARDKLVAELLDRLCARGFLRLGDLRDAVARNRLKLPNLGGPGEFFGGDPLLRADAGLARALDGVYRRGEFYLRWIQRFSSLFFGTPWGRLFTLYVALPFGGAFLLLVFAEELKHIGAKAGAVAGKTFAPKPRPTASVPRPVEPAQPAPAPEPNPEPPTGSPDDPPPDDPDDPDEVVVAKPERVELVTGVFTSSAGVKRPDDRPHEAGHGGGVPMPGWEALAGVGVLLLLVLHVPRVRGWLGSAAWYLWRAARGVFWDVPQAVWRSPRARAVRLSPPVRFARRHFLTPFLLAALAVGVLFLLGLSLRWLLWWGCCYFLALAAAYNHPRGWVLQDQIAEALSDWWRRVRVDLLPGLIATLIDWFRALANWVERQLYAVDEWLRFRGGDSESSFVLKAALGLVWHPLAYVFRFVFYLLAEPQVNPVKHFPVVTVSHKVMAPLLLALVPSLGELIGPKEAYTVYFFTQLLLPGVFGFLAWELKENWRLYASNQASVLRPVVVGSHGESVRRLLRPGFHSGTVPKLYRDARAALAAGDGAKAARLHHDLEHAAEGVHRFAARELVPLLGGLPEFAGVAFEVGAVRFAAQRAEVDVLARPGEG
ncbi:MAG: hypothetical protein K2V38_13730, partial [Gemmataceae bacterium]|nr:hypothetical protein [Gemmataceae bacterium]